MNLYEQYLTRFASGNQNIRYVKFGDREEIEPVDKDYYWQENACYNQIQPVLESRRAKFISYCILNNIIINKALLKAFDKKELYTVVEKLVNVQIRYNKVKNRKAEFINRISMGVLAVEDGSIDFENIETEGLAPGKTLSYRQGSKPPSLLEPQLGSYNIFITEEDRIAKEFTDRFILVDLNDYFRNLNIYSKKE